ncbi:hypothetical protein M8C21_018814, partial [Ambrosia artemisiifolia]
NLEMRRALVKSLGPIHSAFRHYEAKRPFMYASRVLHDVKYKTDVCNCAHSSYMFSRALSAGAANVNYEEVKRMGPLVEYERRISVGELEDGDNCQIGTLREIQRLYDELSNSLHACHLDRDSDPGKTGRSRWLWSRFMPQTSVSPVKGLYLYGGRHKGVSDPLEVVAGEISHESILLCLDEFMILVATSNRAPDNLYERGLQRDLFLPFISTLKERCIIHEIGSSVDYRRRTSAEEGFYFIQKGTSDFLMQRFKELIGEHIARPREVEVVMGRKLEVPLGANGCAYFPFEELCDKPLGAADYFGLCKNFHTLALDGVPIFGLHNRTAAYRFVTLVDVMYENKARLMCTAEGTPFELLERIITIADAQYVAPRTSSRSRKNDDFDLCVDNELGFAKDRTISRLTEMNSKEYLEQHSETIANKWFEGTGNETKNENVVHA